MKFGKMLACYAVGLAVNGCLFLAGFAFAGSLGVARMVAVAVPVTSGLTALMLYWKGESKR